MEEYQPILLHLLGPHRLSGQDRITFRLNSLSCMLRTIVLSSYDAIRKRLSEFYKEAPAKSGAKCGIRRCEFEVAGCFACLLRFVV